MFYKLLKLYLLLWVVYVCASSRIHASNVAVFEKQLAPVFMGNHKTSLSLIIAHPDDEIMFFGPTLQQLDLLLPADIRLNIVCLSTGNAENLGTTRERELRQAVNFLFANSARNMELFQLNYTDGMDVTWNADDISKSVTSLVLSPQGSDREILLSFDGSGVSSHLNHISCHHAVERMLQDNEKVHSAIFLDSHSRNPLLKYSFFIRSLSHIAMEKLSGRTNLGSIRLFNTYPQYLALLATMTNAHQSQMAWFRYGWWFFSSFVFLNDLKIVSK